jgi:hypothetical protein
MRSMPLERSWPFRAPAACRRLPSTAARPLGCEVLLRCGRSKKMPLLNLVVLLIVIGVGLHLINRYVPMASSIKTILNVVVIVVVCVYLLQATGLWGKVSNFSLGR